MMSQSMMERFTSSLYSGAVRWCGGWANCSLFEDICLEASRRRVSGLWRQGQTLSLRGTSVDNAIPADCIESGITPTPDSRYRASNGLRTSVEEHMTADYAHDPIRSKTA